VTHLGKARLPGITASAARATAYLGSVGILAKGLETGESRKLPRGGPGNTHAAKQTTASSCAVTPMLMNLWQPPTRDI